ncbi:MAG: hypothetical protein L0Z50_02450 [Verrucomicrobiales bacterium]|nr:hypothetical protein [Verrucomicrobiales bacterium]
MHNRITKRSRAWITAVIVAMVAGLTFAWLRSGPQIVGQLPRQDMRTIRSLLSKNGGAGLFAALRRGGSDAVVDWILDRRDGRLVRLQVESTNLVLAFLTAATPSQGRLLIIERATNGWRISETNQSVVFGAE